MKVSKAMRVRSQLAGSGLTCVSLKSPTLSLGRSAEKQSDGIDIAAAHEMKSLRPNFESDFTFMPFPLL